VSSLDVLILRLRTISDRLLVGRPTFSAPPIVGDCFQSWATDHTQASAIFNSTPTRVFQTMQNLSFRCEARGRRQHSPIPIYNVQLPPLSTLLLKIKCSYVLLWCVLETASFSNNFSKMIAFFIVILCLFQCQYIFSLEIGEDGILFIFCLCGGLCRFIKF
jgi:hypothetical protein